MKIVKIDGVIGWETDITDIRDQLNAAKGDDVVVEIASPGGLISEGLKIYNELKNYSGNVDTHLTGAVASMATYIAMVGKKRTAENNAIFMIHNGSMLAIGDHRTMFKAGNHLNSLTNMIAKEYSAKTDFPLSEIRTLMDDETFYYGDEIKAAGFVHEMIGDDEPEDRSEAIAIAQLIIDECNEKVNDPAVFKKDIEALATMMSKVPDNIKDNKSDLSDNNKQEVNKMTLEELKEKHPELYNKIIALGVKEGTAAGVTIERGRVKTLTEMRAKFPKAHSQKVIDEAIAEGHDLNQLTLNLMSADQVADELEKAEKDKKDLPPNGDDDVPEMKDGKMKHTDHVDNFVCLRFFGAYGPMEPARKLYTKLVGVKIHFGESR